MNLIVVCNIDKRYKVEDDKRSYAYIIVTRTCNEPHIDVAHGYSKGIVSVVYKQGDTHATDTIEIITENGYNTYGTLTLQDYTSNPGIKYPILNIRRDTYPNNTIFRVYMKNSMNDNDGWRSLSPGTTLTFSFSIQF